MDVAVAIKRRRSIRKYKAKHVLWDIIKELLDAARLAPSGCNAQPWRFIIVDSKRVKENLRKNKAFTQDFVYDAPIIIVCCGDTKDYVGKHGAEYQVEEGSVPKDKKSREEWFNFLKGQEKLRAFKDVTIASSFMMLRATELGLGTSFIGLINRQALKKVLDMPRHFVIPFIMTAGYAAETPAPRPRKSLKVIYSKNKLIAR